MNFWFPFFHKPQPLLDTLPMRSGNGQFAPSPKTLERLRRRASIEAQLAVYVAITTPEQRSADATEALRRAVGE